jgi:hypothetical protein
MWPYSEDYREDEGITAQEYQRVDDRPEETHEGAHVAILQIP